MNDDPLIGTTLGDYEIVTRLGEGGMGVVYGAQQISLNRQVAVKILPAELCGDSEFVARFLREARAAAQLNHPNIVQVIDAGMFQDFYFMVMEFVEGMNLVQMIRLHGPLPEAEALQYLHQAATGLTCAHRRGIFHRDIKPDNLMISREGVLKIADLGLVKWEQSEAATSLTATNIIMGTPQFISPEQIRSARDIDGRTDIYSLGLTGFFMLAGTPPFTAESPGALFAKHLTEPLPSIRELRPEVSLPTERLLQAMTEKDAGKRFQRMEIVVKEVQFILEQEFSIHASDASGPRMEKPRRQGKPRLLERSLSTAARGTVAIAAGLLAVLILVVAYRFMNPPRPPATPPPADTSPPAVAPPTPVPEPQPAPAPVAVAETPVPQPAPQENVSPQPEPSKAKPPEPPSPSPWEQATLPTPGEMEPAAPPQPAETPSRIVKRPMNFEGSVMIRDGMIYKESRVWPTYPQRAAGICLIATHTGNAESRMLVQVGILSKDNRLARLLLERIPSCTSAVLEITPESVSDGARDPEIEVHQVLQPWGTGNPRMFKEETDWSWASRNEKIRWKYEGADGPGFDYASTPLAEVDNPTRTSFRISPQQLNLIRLNVLPELQKMSADYERSQREKFPPHYGWIIKIVRGSGGVRFLSSLSNSSYAPRVALTFEEKAP